MCKIHWSFPRPHPEHMIFNWIHGNIHTASYRLQLALSVKSLPHEEQGGLCDSVQCWLSFCCSIAVQLRGADGMCCGKSETHNSWVQKLRDVALPEWRCRPCSPAPGTATGALLALRYVCGFQTACQPNCQLPHQLLLLFQTSHVFLSSRSSARRIFSVAQNHFSVSSMKM